MKKLLLTLSLAAILLSAKSQIIVTGYLADPIGTDANATRACEYIQFKATQDINFALTPYSVVTCNNAGATGSNFPANGWATGGSKTYQFNISSGTVTKGSFFYVGGDAKTLRGDGSPDISSANWIVSKNYSTVSGNGTNDVTNANILANSGNPAGIAVFTGTIVTTSSVPIDVIFFGGSGGDIYQASPELGYKIVSNDLYNVTDGEYFRKGSNTFIYPHTTSGTTIFVKLGGDYNTTTNKWDVARTHNPITLTNSMSLADIETGGVTTLPVSLTTFTAKPNKSGAVNLAWTTASEKDNSHFEVTRSANGVDFNKLDEVKGNGNSDVERTYSYTDAKPVVGTNYYRLKQVDTDGKFAFSGVATAKVGLSSDNLTAAVSANRTSVAITYNALASGKALFNVYNISGAKIATVERNVNAGVNQISIPANLGNSLHVLSVSQAGATASTKF